MKTNGINVEWVQVGNEINSGMMWPEGSTSNSKNLAGLINSGYKNADFRWFFDNLKANGGKWDVTGMSHYPPASGWATYNAQISTNMWDMAGRFSKPVMIVETGMDWQQAATARSMIADLLNKMRALGGNGLGVFYWEPQGYPGWQGYTLGAINAAGRFTVARDLF